MSCWLIVTAQSLPDCQSPRAHWGSRPEPTSCSIFVRCLKGPWVYVLKWGNQETSEIGISIAGQPDEIMAPKKRTDEMEWMCLELQSAVLQIFSATSQPKTSAIRGEQGIMCPHPVQDKQSSMHIHYDKNQNPKHRTQQNYSSQGVVPLHAFSSINPSASFTHRSQPKTILHPPHVSINHPKPHRNKNNTASELVDKAPRGRKQ